MLIVRGESALPAEELLRRAMRGRIVLLRPEKAGSVEELELAHALAKKNMGEGKAIGKSLETEFVLWLAGKRDIKRAFEEVGFGRRPDGEVPQNFARHRRSDADVWGGGQRGKRGEFIAVSFGIGKKELVAELEMRGKSLKLKKEASAGDVEKISLSRIL